MINRSINQILLEKNLNIPGSDIMKTFICCVFPLLILFLTSDNPLFSIDIEEIDQYQRISNLVLMTSLFFAILSMVAFLKIRDVQIDKFRNYWALFFPKLLLGVSIFFFYLVICFWMIALGGIMSSPFATLLSMSPILLMIQFLRDSRRSYDRIYITVNKALKQFEIRIPKSTHILVKRTLCVTSIVPIIIVILTLILGQYSVIYFDIHRYLLSNTFDKILLSDWYCHVYHFLYYLSVIIATVGVLPANITTNIWEKLFNRGNLEEA
jgi:hypothetical protein